MDKFAKFILQSMVETRVDLFGDGSRFVDFVDDANERFDWSRGYNSLALFGRVTYERDDENVCRSSEPLVLKISPPRTKSKCCSSAFFNEAHFYTRVLPFFESVRPVQHLFPTYYDSLMRLSGSADNLVLVFENVQAAGYVCAKKKAFLDFDHLALMLRKLGEFHSYSYHLKEKAADHFETLIGGISETNVVVLKSKDSSMLNTLALRGSTPVLGDGAYSSKATAFAKVVEDARKVYRDILLQDKDTGMGILCHGDFLATNVLFKYDEEGKPYDVKFVDLGSCRLASPVCDLITVLYLNADQSLRSERWDDLMDEYYRSLRSTFPDCACVPSREAICEQFIGRASLAYIIASGFLPMLIAEDNGLPGYKDLLPDKFETTTAGSLPRDVYMEIFKNIAGDVGTKALSDILKDMIDRGFV